MALGRSKATPDRTAIRIVPQPIDLPRHDHSPTRPSRPPTPAPKILVRVRQPAPAPAAVPVAKGQKGLQNAKTASVAGLVTILHDDFSVANLADPNCPWSTGYPWGQTLNNEREYYTRYDKSFPTACDKGGTNHIYTSGGTLQLTAKYETGKSYEVWSWPGGVFTQTCVPYSYTSAMLFSKSTFLYGQFEIKCKIPHAGTKLWPAFWLFSGGPYREIDIFEFEDPTTPNNLLMNIHIDRNLDFGQNQSGAGSENHYGAAVQLPDVSGFHVYAVQWRPNSVTWLVDGVPVRLLAGHSPPLDMNLIINLAIAPWRPAPSPSDMAALEIDYVTVSRITDPEFLYHWGNQGDGKIALWNLKPSDRLIAGQFSGAPRTQLLTVADNGWAHLMRWDGSSWQFVWGNNGANLIASWQMKPSDRFCAGDFDGNGRDDLLAVAVNGWSHLMRWDGTSWQYSWGNNGSNLIASWQMKPSDRYVVGDFNGDGRDEVLAIAANGWSHLMRWDGSSWQYVWGNNGANQIALWKMRPDDRYIAGDFDGDGRDEVLVIAANNGWSHLIRWDGSAWQYVWGNNGDNQIGLWQMRPTDRYFVGDFEGTGRSQVAVVSNQGWAHAMFWSGSAWQYMWGNDGGQTIHRWFMNPTDRYNSGAFDGGKSLVLATAANGWAHLLKFEPVP